jgi:site-specific recombinase XerD
MKCLSKRDVALLVRAIDRHPRERALVRIALATGLRAHELLGLNVGDVVARGAVCRSLELRIFKRSRAPQLVVLSQATRHDIEAFLLHKRACDESLAPDAPLFVSRRARRLSLRALRHLFRVWQERAGLSRVLNFHALRHTACTNFYRTTRDLRLTQMFARHASITSTAIYTHPTEDDLIAAVERMSARL